MGEDASLPWMFMSMKMKNPLHLPGAGHQSTQFPGQMLVGQRHLVAISTNYCPAPLLCPEGKEAAGSPVPAMALTNSLNSQYEHCGTDVSLSLALISFFN